MTISGFSMCRNADKLYYPIIESIRSALPLVDEFVVAVGKGDADDQTLDLLRSIQDPKLKIIETEWDLNRFPKGTIHAQQTDLAKAHCKGDWLLYLQADEVIHEDDLNELRSNATKYLNDPEVDGFLFDYIHFWGDYTHHVRTHGWYRKEIRMIRNDPQIHSWESAQSFKRIKNFDGNNYRNHIGAEKLKVVKLDARIFHYGWVRPPHLMIEKMKRLDRIHGHQVERFHDDRFDYGVMHKLPEFSGSHPKEMQSRIAKHDWSDQLNSRILKRMHRFKHERFKYILLTWIEDHLLGGRQIFHFENYHEIKK